MPQQLLGEIRIPVNLIDQEIEAEIIESFGYNKAGEQIHPRNNCSALSDQGILTCTNATAENGTFEVLEYLLCEKNIPFDRYSDSGDDFSAEHVYFRPDQDSPETKVLLSSDGNDPFVPTPDLRSLLSLPLDDVIEKLQQLLNIHDPQVALLTNYVIAEANLLQP